MRRVASATRCGSSTSSASGLAVLTAQKPHALVQRSPAIMNVAVPLLQHSQGFGHLALSHTVCRRKPSSRLRVWPKVSVVGSLRRSHSGMRGRGLGAIKVGSTALMKFVSLRSCSARLKSLLLPPHFKLVRTEVGEDLAIHVNHRRLGLTRKREHLLPRSSILDDIQCLVGDTMSIEPFAGFVAPTAERFDEEPDLFRFHSVMNVSLCS